MSTGIEETTPEVAQPPLDQQPTETTVTHQAPIDTTHTEQQPIDPQPAAELSTEPQPVEQSESPVAEQSEPIAAEPTTAETPTPEPEASPIEQRPIESLKVGMEVRGKVKKIELYGAFVDIGVGQDGLLHISQLSTERVKNVNDKVKVGDDVTVWIRNVDVAQRRIDLTLINDFNQPRAQPQQNQQSQQNQQRESQPQQRESQPQQYQQQSQQQFQQPQQQQSDGGWSDIRVGQELMGKVVRVEKFGAFIDVGAERPGMVHVSELTNGYVNSPSEVVKVGDEIRVKVIKVNSKKKQIDLSVKALEQKVEMPRDAEEDLSNLPTAMEFALRQAMQGTEMGDQLMTAPRAAKPIRKAAESGKRNNKQRSQQNEILTRTLQNRPK